MVDRAGEGDAGAEQAVSLEVGFLEHALHELRGEVEGALGVVVDVVGGRALGEHAAAQV